MGNPIREVSNLVEIWKSIKSYEGIYEISNLGRVKSLERGVWNSGNSGKRGCWRINKEKILKSPISSHGYPNIGLRVEGNIKVVCVHRLVAEAFILNPKNKKTVNHKNGERTDNRLVNLEWATYSENSYHSYRELGRVGALKGKPSWNKGLKTNILPGNAKKIIVAKEDGSFVQYDSILSAAKATGISSDGIRWKIKNPNANSRINNSLTYSYA